MDPKPPFLPLFFVNYWKFFQKIFFAFSPLFPAGIAPQKPCFRKKAYTLPGVSNAFFTHISPGKYPSGKQFPATMFLTKTGFAVIMFLL